MYNKQSYILFAVLFLFSACTQSDPADPEKLETFPLTSVELLESPFSQAQQTDKEYILELEADRLLAPYLIEAGLEPKAPKYGNWENTGLDGHIGGALFDCISLNVCFNR
ncbi:Beta-L-arabinofuranosidase, GH127 [Gracilimonas mengyeensis]|uniref:Beta-L-arabinofuranosidase, GH127 n=1 Tax=Gracilimonas mengyeensis TaxID=1302730 RepID=A0A521EPX2_9BACT|nr:beta-L-arabinofuranosidase domain-containing protein [Gracilimonas mengyeensis]SMO85983.1 Beta-L-arabinofuranosidase, GH127 [Gracilimonas mengyeensis]